jgi:hypothetical protein
MSTVRHGTMLASTAARETTLDTEHVLAEQTASGSDINAEQRAEK